MVVANSKPTRLKSVFELPNPNSVQKIKMRVDYPIQDNKKNKKRMLK